MFPPLSRANLAASSKPAPNPCIVRMTSSTRPRHLASILDIPADAKITTYQRALGARLTQVSSSIAIAPPIPLPWKLFGRNKELPEIQCVITHVNFSFGDGEVKLVLHPATKERMLHAYDYFLTTAPMRHVLQTYKQFLRNNFSNGLEKLKWKISAEILDVIDRSGRANLTGWFETLLSEAEEADEDLEAEMPMGVEELLKDVVEVVKELFTPNLPANVPCNIWGIPWNIRKEDLKTYSGNEVFGAAENQRTNGYQWDTVEHAHTSNSLLEKQIEKDAAGTETYDNTESEFDPEISDESALTHSDPIPSGQRLVKLQAISDTEIPFSEHRNFSQTDNSPPRSSAAGPSGTPAHRRTQANARFTAPPTCIQRAQEGPHAFSFPHVRRDFVSPHHEVYKTYNRTLLLSPSPPEVVYESLVSYTSPPGDDGQAHARLHKPPRRSQGEFELLIGAHTQVYPPKRNCNGNSDYDEDPPSSPPQRRHKRGHEEVDSDVSPKRKKVRLTSQSTILTRKRKHSNSDTDDEEKLVHVKKMKTHRSANIYESRQGGKMRRSSDEMGDPIDLTNEDEVGLAHRSRSESQSDQCYEAEEDVTDEEAHYTSAGECELDVSAPTADEEAQEEIYDTIRLKSVEPYDRRTRVVYHSDPRLEVVTEAKEPHLLVACGGREPDRGWEDDDEDDFMPPREDNPEEDEGDDSDEDDGDNEEEGAENEDDDYEVITPHRTSQNNPTNNGGGANDYFSIYGDQLGYGAQDSVAEVAATTTANGNTDARSVTNHGHDSDYFSRYGDQLGYGTQDSEADVSTSYGNTEAHATTNGDHENDYFSRYGDQLGYGVHHCIDDIEMMNNDAALEAMDYSEDEEGIRNYRKGIEVRTTREAEADEDEDVEDYDEDYDDDAIRNYGEGFEVVTTPNTDEAEGEDDSMTGSDDGYDSDSEDGVVHQPVCGGGKFFSGYDECMAARRKYFEG